MSAASGSGDKKSEAISLAGEAAIVTGAGRGFGRAIAMGLVTSLIAAVLYRQYSRGNDDATAVVVKTA